MNQIVIKEEDPIVESVLNKYSIRSKQGIAKYGMTMEQNNLSLNEWLTHLQEELMDATLYIEKAMTQDAEITKLVKETPNDMQLGEKIRNLVR